jgi:hypothetical protein
MQTLTTVGYGDIKIVSDNERAIVIFLQFVGVIFFSFASGSLTNIIKNHESYIENNHKKINILNKLL